MADEPEPGDGKGAPTPTLGEVLLEGETKGAMVHRVRQSIHRRQLSGHAIELYFHGIREVCLKYLRLFSDTRT